MLAKVSPHFTTVRFYLLQGPRHSRCSLNIELMFELLEHKKGIRSSYYWQLSAPLLGMATGEVERRELVLISCCHQTIGKL